MEHQVDSVLACDGDGNTLTAFHPVGGKARFDDGPMPLALVAVWHGERLLLVLNRLRRCWELPGGLIDPGETPHDAALRELREETGLHLTELALVGYARFVLGHERRIEYAALYTAQAAPDASFIPNEEISAICWWDGSRPLADRVQPLDAYLADLSRTCPQPPDGPAGKGGCAPQPS